ncbi:butyrophilin subfamily 2 member A2-like [Perca fluviatilis]|uniref:butyrophilin subfamily 2 member A2-like n=1 Tax=Perca fluviatilis TaxID=8168 RepID=UPI00196334F7|nr:butyrophilin subfamily 2 member A2-like [Perca fluviatilis]
MAPFLVLLLFLSGAASDGIEVTVHPGHNATLPCQAAGSSIRAVEWTRPDLKPDTVLLYRNGRLDPTYQHPSFKGRVELVDRDLKGRDASLILKNVSSNDTGTYKCGVTTSNSTPTDSDIDPITVRLQVTESAGSKDRNSSPGGRDHGLAAGVLLLVPLLQWLVS